MVTLARWLRIAAFLFLAVALWAQEFDGNLFSAMRWRLIGPFRAGRVTSVAGISGQPNVYYFGTPGGGVWKTTDAGHVWQPVFDRQPVNSIGAVTVAPSDPKTVYVGTGELTRGDGIYKSTDSGATWSHAGLTDTPFIQAIVVDPQNPNIAIAGANSLGLAMLWRPLPSSAFTSDRGIYKTVDGGKTWKKVLTKDDTAGVVDLCADPNNPRTLYASLLRPASGLKETGTAATSEIFKSVDEGSTWKPLVSKGLPEEKRGRVGIVVAGGTQGRRLYAVMEQGFFRSDDGGASWRQSNKDPRIVGSAYFSRIFVDTRNPDILYVAQTSLYRSIDGGKSFEAYVGAPSGDDFHVLWIDPRNAARMLLGVDQGAIVSVDAGRTWSSWYNQPTGQFYHVSTDQVFPYHVYAAQQDSGTAAVASRSDYGEIGERDWLSIGGFEYCFIAPDPRHPESVFSGGWYGTVVKFDKVTGQLATVFEKGDKYRTAQMAPLTFSPKHADTLYLGTQFVLKTTDEGKSWQQMSPDLTGWGEKEDESKDNPDKPKPPAITALGVSTVQDGEMWAGTSNRLLYVTHDSGATWKNVTPPGLTAPSQISYVEPSHYDSGTAYVTVSAAREWMPPLVLRTHDAGATWQKAVHGLPERETVRVVREDPVRKGMLYAGTDTTVFVSMDDGDHWHSLKLNLPSSPVTDIDVHGEDLVISTYGRALWILDDLEPLREWNPLVTNSEVHLFQPATGVRVLWDNNQDTPYPPETPAGKNPPDGAIIDYFLKSAAAGEIKLVIRDGRGQEVRRYSSQANAPELPLPNVPSYWFAPVAALPTAAGLNRFVWDLRYPSPPVLPFAYSGGLLDYTEYTLADHAIPSDTPRQQPQGPLVVPGDYSVELEVGGRTYRNSLSVRLDPRVHASQEDLKEQADLEKRTITGMEASFAAFNQAKSLSAAIDDRTKAVKSERLKEAAAALKKNIDGIQNGPATAPGFGLVNRDLTRLLNGLQSANVRPSDTQQSAVEWQCQSLGVAIKRWRRLNMQDVSALNEMLSAEKVSLLPVAAVADDNGRR